MTRLNRTQCHFPLFLLTCLLRGMTINIKKWSHIIKISTHMPLARHDHSFFRCFAHRLKFLLTCLLRGMTQWNHSFCAISFISTHMPLARHDLFLSSSLHDTSISTHMPLARHDYIFVALTQQINISTHMPLARHDVWDCSAIHPQQYFYSHASCEA